MTITCDKHTFNFARKEGFTFLVVADEVFGRQIPFAFLERVSEDFFNNGHASKAKAAAAPHSLNRTFAPVLKQHMVGAVDLPYWVATPAAKQLSLPSACRTTAQTTQMRSPGLQHARGRWMTSRT
jgi:hypothetical protein